MIHKNKRAAARPVCFAELEMLMPCDKPQPPASQTPPTFPPSLSPVPFVPLAPAWRRSRARLASTSCHYFYCFSRCDDRNFLIGFEGEQVIISRDYEVNLTRDSRRQHLVVIGISANGLHQ